MKECPSCGAAVPDSANHCPSCQYEYPGGAGSKKTLMGVPGERSDAEDSSSEGSGEERGERAEKSTEYAMPAVGDETDAGGEEDTTSTQFGLPSVEADSEPLDPEAETPMPEPEVSPEDDPQRTGNWTGWDEEVGEEPSEEEVLSAWGISAEETSDVDDVDESDGEASEAGRADSPVGEESLKTHLGMPKVEAEAESSSPRLAEASEEGVGGELSEQERTEEFRIETMDELERQVRELDEGADDAQRGEDRPEDVEAQGPDDEEAGQAAAGAGVVRKPGSSEGAQADSGVVSGGNDSGVDSGVGTYQSSGTSRTRDPNDSGVLGGGTYRKHDVEPDESGGIPAASQRGGEESAERESISAPGGVEEPEQAPAGEESSGSKVQAENPAESGFPAERDGPTGFQVDRSDDELSMPGEAGFGRRLGDDESSSGGQMGEAGEDLEAPSEPGEPGGIEASVDEITFETEDASEGELELFGEEESTGSLGAGAGGEEDEPDRRPDRGGREQEQEPRDVPEEEGGQAPGRIERDVRPAARGTSGEADSGSGSGGTESAPPAAGEAGNEQEDGLGSYAVLVQTVCGVLAGMSFGMALLVQVLAGDASSEILALALGVANGLGAVASIAMAFVPMNAMWRGALYLGVGVVVAALAVGTMTAGPIGLSIGPLVALFGSIFAAVAGLIPAIVRSSE